MTKAAEAVVFELKRCPRCEESLPLSEFGVCRARKDGLNLYCKRCIRQKIALKPPGAARIQDCAQQAWRRGQQIARDHRCQIRFFAAPDCPHAAKAVARRSRARGHSLRRETQKEIVQVTKLPKDEVCDALANLLLWTREIRTQIVRHQRRYFVNEAAEEPAKGSDSQIQTRPDALPSARSAS